MKVASHHFAGKGPVASTSSKFGHITSYLGPGLYDFRMLSDWLCVAGASVLDLCGEQQIARWSLH